ncbi:MAG: cadherin repeat domain-containing protein, partial [Betaproteobacteria bacterium]|nr:cadherin repeat domain-containing protein [Betaproteobacteria bacterium]
MASSAFQDLAGNLNTDGADANNKVSLPVDTLAPSLVITDNVSESNANGPVTFTFTFSEPVTGFTTDDITASVGSKGALNGSGAVYTMTISPPVGTGTITVNVAPTGYTDSAGNFGVSAATNQQGYNVVNNYTLGQPIIDLGVAGKLIHPVQVDGGKWYYYWDRSNNGNQDSNDRTSHNELDAVFKYTFEEIYQSIFPPTPDSTVTNTTDTVRFSVINGVKLALPTTGGAASTPYGPAGLNAAQPSTSVALNGINPTYNDLLAIWDAYNGSTDGSNGISGIPPNWAPYFWSATAVDGLHHTNVGLDRGVVYNTNDADTSFYVALEVLPSQRVNRAPTITSNGGGATGAISYAENGTGPITAVTATDPDTGDTKSFSLSGGADQALFGIDSVSGALNFLVSPDFEGTGDNSYEVKVKVSDAAGLFDEQILTVNVTNVNEAPATAQSSTLNYVENQAATPINP